MGLGMGEVLVILIIAFTVVGPEDLPNVARTLAKTLKDIKRAFAGMNEEIKMEPPMADLSEDLIKVRKEISKL